MPIKLNVGISRKIGLPDYCSAGASCNLEVELDSGLLQHDLNAFHAQVREAFDAAQQAVNDELARLQAQLTAPPPVVLPAPRNGNGRAPHANGPPARPAGANGRNGVSRGRPAKPCTVHQVRAIRAIARNLGFDLENRLRQEYGVEQLNELTLPQASALIDSLKSINES